MIGYLLIPILLYVVFLIILAISNHKTHDIKLPSQLPKVAVVIPFRNEANNLESLIQSILAQSYPKTLFKCYLVDDHSEDDGRFKVHHDSSIVLLDNKGHGKKAAIDTALSDCEEDIILSTDADSVLNEKWIETMVSTMVERNLDVLIGGVNIKANSVISRFLKIELNNLVAAAIAAANINRPFVSNGANMAYRKSLYFEAKAIRTDHQLASGDDVFLLFASKKLKAKIGSLNAVNSTVVTSMKEDLKSIFHQRIRWIKKASSYKDFDTIVISSLIFFCNLSCLFAWFLPLNTLYVFVAFFFKWIAEYILYLSLKQNRFNLQEILYSIILSLAYPFYTFVVALAALVVKPKWKGRTV